MIFVAVGTQKFQFNRLLYNVDKIIEEGMLGEEVFAQIGHSDYMPKNYEYKDFLSKDEFERNIKRCDLLITHSGVATIIAGLKYGKPVIVVPRLEKYNEHVDDHQMQIAQSFANQNFILMCSENGDFKELIEKAKMHSFAKYESQRENVLKTIRSYLENI